MDAARTARRFPLVARPRPVCTPLADRVREISDLSHTAQHDGDVQAATVALNKAALLASDCALPALARSLCLRHTHYFLRARPLGPQEARYALEPLVNLARLLLRENRADDAHRLLNTLLHAVTSGTDAVIDGQHLPLRDLTDSPDGHRTIHQWLWTVMLADGTRALAGAGRWTEALHHVEHHRGIGNRLLDGRQVAVLAHGLTGRTPTALTLLDDTTPTEPWEEAVAACLRTLTLLHAEEPAGSAVADMTERYLALLPTPDLAVFHTRLGLTALDLADLTNLPAQAATIVTRLRETALSLPDGYTAHDILTHPHVRPRLDRPAVDELTATLHRSALAQGTLPTAVMETLTAATVSCETAITRHLAY